MKYYCRGSLLDKIESQNYELLVGVDVGYGRRGFLKKNVWGAGWIYEADESFRSWCAIAYGFDLAHVTEDEYRQLTNNGIAFFSRERTDEFRNAITSQLNLIDKIRFEKYR